MMADTDFKLMLFIFHTKNDLIIQMTFPRD